ncbi:HNH endonuclease family protein [Kineococcus sp. NPDC059986]|uniref:HNH endonuclease family protein n=1 Tax=Kineococcus sp. NPDC059986 TaxID=3155538 RepID=UPI00344B7A51
MRYRNSWSRVVAAGALAVAVPVLAGCGLPAATAVDPSAPSDPASSPASSPVSSPVSSPSAGVPSPSSSAVTTPQAGTAAAALATLPVKGRAPRTGYGREQFGDGWVDTDRNGCDTHNDVLARDLTADTFKPGTRDCVVLTGTLADPYSGATIAFTRGETTSSAVQVDHVVALSDAWQKGAQQWDPARRAAFANDPLELLAVDGPLNAQKGDGDAATWLPPNRAYRCAYVARQIAVKATWGLWVTAAERDAMARVLAACPGEPVPMATAPASGAVAPAPAAVALVPAPAPAPVAVSESPQVPAPSTVAPPPVDPAVPPVVAAAAGTDPDLGTCKAAKAAGYGPYVEGEDPEYAFYRDADHVICGGTVTTRA